MGQPKILKDSSGNYWAQEGSRYRKLQTVPEGDNDHVSFGGEIYTFPRGDAPAQAKPVKPGPRIDPAEAEAQKLDLEANTAEDRGYSALDEFMKTKDPHSVALQKKILDDDKANFESRNPLSQFLRDPARAAEVNLKKSRPSLGDVSLDDLINGKADPVKAFGTMTTGGVFGTPTALARGVAKGIPKIAGDVYGGVASIPSALYGRHQSLLADQSQDLESKKRHYEAADKAVKKSQELAGTSAELEKWLDEKIPGKKLARTSIVGDEADSLGQALPLVLGGALAKSPKIAGQLFMANDALSGWNRGIHSGAPPEAALANALSQMSLRAGQNMLPIARTVETKGGDTWLSKALGLGLETTADTAASNLAENRLIGDWAGKKDILEGIGQKGAMAVGMRSLHGKGKTAYKGEDVEKIRQKMMEEWKAGVSELERIHNIATRVRGGGEPFDFNAAMAPVEGDPHAPVSTMASSGFEFDAPVPKRFFDKFRKPAQGRKDIGVQERLQGLRGQGYADTVVAEKWAKKGADAGDIAAVEDWMLAAQTNHDLGVDALAPGAQKPKGGVYMPVLTPEQKALLQDRMKYGDGMRQEYMTKQLIKMRRGLSEIAQKEGADPAEFISRLESGDPKLAGRPDIAALFKDYDLDKLNPYYSPRIYKSFAGTDSPNDLPPDAMKTASGREQGRVFYMAADKETGKRTPVIKAQDGTYRPFDWVNEVDPVTKTVRNVMQFKAPLDFNQVERSAFTSPVRDEVRLFRRKLDEDHLGTLAKQRLDLRKKTSREGVLASLLTDSNITQPLVNGPVKGYRTPEISFGDEGAKRALDPIGDNPTAVRDDVANVLEAFLGNKRTGNLSKAGRIAKALQEGWTRLTLSNPLVHLPNVGEHNAKALGAGEMFGGDPSNFPDRVSMAGDLRQTMAPEFQYALQHGLKDLTLPNKAMSADVSLGNNTTNDPLAAYNMEHLAKGPLSRLSDSVVWDPDSNLRLAHWLKTAGEKGGGNAKRDLAGILPDYNIPVNFFDTTNHPDSGLRQFGNKVWQGLSGNKNESPDTAAMMSLIRPMFWRYRNNSLASTANTLIDASNLDPKAASKIGAIGAMNLGPYAAMTGALNEVFGDDDREYHFRKPGTSHYVKMADDLKDGKLGVMETLARLYSMPPLLRIAHGVTTGKDPISGRDLTNEKGQFAVESVVPQGFAVSNALKGTDWASLQGLVSGDDKKKALTDLLGGEENTKMTLDNPTLGLLHMMNGNYGNILANQLGGVSDKSEANKLASYLTGGQKLQGEQVNELDALRERIAADAVKRQLKRGDKKGYDAALESPWAPLTNTKVNNLNKSTFNTNEENLARRVQTLDDQKALDVYWEATDEEKAILYKVVADKLLRGGSENQIKNLGPIRAKLAKDFQEVTERLAYGPYRKDVPYKPRHLEAELKMNGGH